MKKRTRNALNRSFARTRNSDRLSKTERSKRMSLIRSHSTKFEEGFVTALRKVTHKKFTRNDKTMLGKPDIVFHVQKVCVFLDSDFWHGWQYPRWKHLLKDAFWRNKIERNRKRDRLVTKCLRRHGWIVIRIWEHDMKRDFGKTVTKVLMELYY